MAEGSGPIGSLANPPMMPGGIYTSPNPFGMLNQLTEWQQKLNANRLFQSQFMANQALGEIIANSPDLESGLAIATKNPLVMGFATQGLENLRAAQMLSMQSQQIEAGLATTGWEAAMKAGAAAMLHPENTGEIFGAVVKGLPAASRKGALPMIQAVEDAMTRSVGGIDMSTPEGQQQARQRAASVFAGFITAAGGNPDTLKALGGTTILTPEGVPAFQAGPFGGMGGQAPGTVTPIIQPGGPQNAPGTTQAESPPNPIKGGQYDTTPNIPWARNPQGQVIRDYMGFPKLTKEQEANEATLQGDYAKEKNTYEAALGVSSTLAQMGNAADRLNAKDSWTQTGWGGKLRAEIANLVQTYNSVTGKQVPPDVAASLADDTANMATIEKASRQLAYGMENSFQGEGRHAFGLFQQTMAAVPGLENTPFAFAELSAGLKAMADYTIAKRGFKQAWLQNPASYGHLFGAEEAFNAQSSPTDFMRRALTDNLKSSLEKGYLGRPVGTNPDGSPKFAPETLAAARKIFTSLREMK